MELNINNLPNNLKTEKIVEAKHLKQAEWLQGFPKSPTELQNMLDRQSDPKISEEFLNTSWRCLKACVDNNALGISANQIGINKKLFLIGKAEGVFGVYIHPSYVNVKTSTTVNSPEGCLSVRGTSLVVPRQTEILASWFEFDSNGVLNHKEEVIFGKYAQCFLHELDHFNCISIIDRAVNLNRSQKRNYYL